MGFQSQIYEAVAGDLGEHVVQKWQAGNQPGLAGSIQVQLQLDLSFLSIPLDAGGTLAARGHNKKRPDKKSAQYTFVAIECPVSAAPGHAPLEAIHQAAIRKKAVARIGLYPAGQVLRKGPAALQFSHQGYHR